MRACVCVNDCVHSKLEGIMSGTRRFVVDFKRFVEQNGCISISCFGNSIYSLCIATYIQPYIHTHTHTQLRTKTNTIDVVERAQLKHTFGAHNIH